MALENGLIMKSYVRSDNLTGYGTNCEMEQPMPAVSEVRMSGYRSYQRIVVRVAAPGRLRFP